MNSEYDKSMFIYRAIQDGWSVRKHASKYVFKRKHKNNKDYFMPTFVDHFIHKYKQL
jgi:hypothetical protein